MIFGFRLLWSSRCCFSFSVQKYRWWFVCNKNLITSKEREKWCSVQHRHRPKRLKYDQKQNQMKKILRTHFYCSCVCASPRSLSKMKNQAKIHTKTWSSSQKKTSSSPVVIKLIFVDQVMRICLPKSAQAHAIVKE